MHKFKKLLLAPVLGVMLLIPQSSCTVTEDCAASLADLTMDLIPAAASVAAGNIFALASIVPNVMATGTSCGTETAPNTATDLDVEYSSDGSTYGPASMDNFISVPPIPGGSQAEQDLEVMFSTPGYYQITTTADGRQQCGERNESNNVDEAGGRGDRTSEIPQGIIIRVLPNPNYTPSPDTPMFQILSVSEAVITPIPSDE
jgi:hypothetical protein